MSLRGRKAQTPQITQAADHTAPLPVEQSAAERLNTLLAEQDEINATLAEHREKRAKLLADEAAFEFDAIQATTLEIEKLKLRLEWISAQLPAIQHALAEQQREEFEAAWQATRPTLARAETDLAETIRAFQLAHEHANAVFFRAEASFGERLTREFVRPPPPAPVYNDWSLRQFLDVVKRRQSATPAAPSIWDLVVDVPMNIPPEKKFQPRRVPIEQIEAISPLAPSRRVKILHGPCRTANLAAGIARMFEGEEHVVNARAAFALTMSGVARYIDDRTITAA